MTHWSQSWDPRGGVKLETPGFVVPVAAESWEQHPHEACDRSNEPESQQIEM